MQKMRDLQGRLFMDRSEMCVHGHRYVRVCRRKERILQVRVPWLWLGKESVQVRMDLSIRYLITQ